MKKLIKVFMTTRLITAAVGIPFLIFTLIVRGWFAEFVIVVLTFIAMYENYRALKKAGYYVCEWGGYAAAAAMWPLSRQMGVLDPLLLVVAAMGVSMTGVMLREKPTFPDASASVYPLFTCFLPMSMFMMMMNSTYGGVPGVALITMAFAIAYGGDGAAYFGGRAFGKHKLCPVVSPKKTVEGAIGGVLGTMVFGVVATIIYSMAANRMEAFTRSNIGVSMYVIIALLGCIAAVLGIYGDLFASVVKRQCGIKDYGTIFPGHGGILDRFDSVMFIAPFVTMVITAVFYV